MDLSHPWIVPNWPAPKWIQALTTLRSGGASVGPFQSFNLANHVNDDPAAVLKNRDFLKKQAKLPSDPIWLQQVHGTRVIHVEDFHPSDPPPEADAAISTTPGKIASVLTADCLPILLCNDAGAEVAAIHAGWRGLASGIIETTVAALTSNGEQLLAWLGPAIGPTAFEVGEEMKSAFTQPKDETAFKPFISQGSNTEQKWTADIYQLARFRLQALNITRIYGGDYCTFSEPERFYSFRRSNPTGRMATIIWMNIR